MQKTVTSVLPASTAHLDPAEQATSQVTSQVMTHSAPGAQVQINGPQLQGPLTHLGAALAANVSSTMNPSAQRLTCGLYSSESGNVRRRLPVNANTALATAGAITGRPGSPTPVGAASFSRRYVSITGTSFIRSGAKS